MTASPAAAHDRRSRPRGIPRADRIVRAVFALVALTTVALLLSIFVFLLWNALPALRGISVLDALFNAEWNPGSYHEPQWGIGALLAGTFLIVACSMLLAVPVAVLIALYLAEVAGPRSREILKPLVEMIAGVPSVVLGLLGLLYLAPLVARAFGLSNGLNALTASLLVALSALPGIASLAEDALSSVPRGLRDASLALGASRWTTIWRVTLPAATSGIGAAAMLGLGRAIGETMIVLMVAGNSLSVPRSLTDAVRPVTSTIAIEIKETVVGSLHWSALFALGLLLFLVTLAVNALADVLIRRTRA